MTEAEPVRVAYASPFPGLRLARQGPPANAASACVSFVGAAGSGFDPRGQEGAALLTAQVATSGAGPYDRVELARLLDRLGATLTYQLAPESVEFSVWGPAPEWRKLLAILSEVVLRPRFDRDDIARVRRQLVERQMREREQPSHRAERELLRAIFPHGHPYRETGLGTPGSAALLERSALKEFHARHYLTRGGLVVATLAPSLPALTREVRERFRCLEAGEEAPSLRFPAPGAGGSTHRVDLPERSQVDLRLGGPSLPRSDPQYPALFLAEEVLGGRPLLSRLFQAVREKEGLAYHASSQLEAMRYGGYWTVQAGTSAAHATRALRLLTRELDRLREEPVAEAELTLIRESVIGELPLSLETTADAHELAVDLAYHELPSDFLETWPTTLRAVTPAEIQAAARRGMDSRRAVTVIAGPKAPGSR